MGLKRTHEKKSKSGPVDSGLFSMLGQNLPHGHLDDSEASLRNYMSFQDAKYTHEAMLEAEFRKAEAITLACRYLIGK